MADAQVRQLFGEFSTRFFNVLNFKTVLLKIIPTGLNVVLFDTSIHREQNKWVVHVIFTPFFLQSSAAQRSWPLPMLRNLLLYGRSSLQPRQKRSPSSPWERQLRQVPGGSVLTRLLDTALATPRMKTKKKKKKKCVDGFD